MWPARIIDVKPFTGIFLVMACTRQVDDFIWKEVSSGETPKEKMSPQQHQKQPWCNIKIIILVYEILFDIIYATFIGHY